LRVLGLDSATRTGYGLAERDGARERLLAHGVLDLNRARAAFMESFADTVLEGGPVDLVAIEDNYLDTNPEKANVATLKALARIVGRWEQVWEARKVKTVLVPAQRWQTGLLAGLMGPRANRDTRKRAAGLWVKATFGLELDQDACDGVCLAVWVARQRAFEARARPRAVTGANAS
jgi:hypothetical protein